VWDWAEIDTEDGNLKVYPFPSTRVRSTPKNNYATATSSTVKDECNGLSYPPPHAER